MSFKLSSLSLLAGSLATTAAFAFVFTRFVSERRSKRAPQPDQRSERTGSPPPVRARRIPANERVRFGEPEGRRGFSQVTADLDLYAESELDLSEYAQDIDGGVSARPAEAPPEHYEHYDAIEADEVGSMFLARATQAPRLFEEPLDDAVELPRYPGHAVEAGATVSEASASAALSLDEEPRASTDDLADLLAPPSTQSPSTQSPTTVWEATQLELNRRG